ncbi:MAG: hypothetical protein D6726_02905 [Nitrospirae bacterium]|nr:MAG: hypothetical protein D6726_02905 [Nitrospirota bacterium]
MGLQYNEFHIQLINARTGNPIDDDSGVYNVLTAGSPTEATIYSDPYGTSASNPGTISNGEITFYTDSSVTSVDISIYTASGDAIFLQGVTTQQQRVLVDVDKLEQTLVIPFGASDNTETDTGFTVVGPALIEDVFLKVTTADSGETINFGLNGTTTNDPDGLVTGASVSSTGYVSLGPTVSAGVNEDYFSACGYGALLADFTAGSDAATDVGTFSKKCVLIDSSETDANFTYTGSAGSDTAAGYFIVKMRKLL